MHYTICNELLSVRVCSFGAELQSIRGADGTEYLWQGDPAYWQDRSPNLFPYIGRMIGKQYRFQGKQYSMPIHGIAPYAEFDLVEQAGETLVFQLTANQETLLQYPWKFRFQIVYRLCNNRLDITFAVRNDDTKQMLFAVGGHPGFRVPLNPGECFTDYRLSFPGTCQPQRIVFTSDCFVDDHTLPYSLENGSIPLGHDLFDEDAIVLKNTSKTVILHNSDSSRSVTVSFPQMDYIGFWHMPQTDAPYVCIEPWSSLPSAKGGETVLEQQKDLLTLEAGGIYQNTWSIEIG